MRVGIVRGAPRPASPQRPECPPSVYSVAGVCVAAHDAELTKMRVGGHALLHAAVGARRRGTMEVCAWSPAQGP